MAEITQMVKNYKILKKVNVICIHLLYGCDRKITREKRMFAFYIEWRRLRGAGGGMFMRNGGTVK